MTTISAKIIADSISEQDIRLTTMELRYPRCIHSEFMTHRQFSRNAASSRAIPVVKMIASIMEDPFIPLVWGKNQAGMQAGAEHNSKVFVESTIPVGCTNEEAWLYARDRAAQVATAFAGAGYHKQIVNRLLEPFMHITVVCSATEWSNFFALREHKDAEPHMQLLATKMRDAYDNSKPALIHYGEWHTPYVDRVEAAGEKWDVMCQMSAARCARTSYLLHNGERPNQADDIGLYQRLAQGVPLHASPLEHQATPDRHFTHSCQWGNFRGWRQFRKMHAGECQ